MSTEAERFLAELQAEILDRSSGGDGSEPDFRENVFTEYVVELLSAEIGIAEDPAVVHFSGEYNRGRAKVNAYALPEDPADDGAIDLFVAVYRGFTSPTRIRNDEVQSAAEQALRYLTGALAGMHDRMEPSTDQYEMTSRIHDAGRTLRKARIFILTDGETDLARRKSATTTVRDVEVRLEFWDIERLARALAHGRPQEEIEIDVTAMNGTPLPCVTADTGAGDYSAYVMILPGQLLHRLYEEHGARLLERNVRSFLQAKGKVNRGIRDTLREDPQHFLAYNNGISMTADAVETDTSSGCLAITRIKGLQIVNGGQTTASINRAAKTDKIDLTKVFVQAKLTVIAKNEMDVLAPRIAEYANTQNPIQMADFSANDAFHIEIERLSNTVWNPDQQGRWFYERARGQFFVAQATEGSTDARLRRFRERTPPHRKFTKIDLAKFMSAWDQLPHHVSGGGQKNFVNFTQRLRETKPKTWRPDDRFYKEVIAKAIIFHGIMGIVKREKFAGYRSNIVAYTMALLSFRSGSSLDLLAVWNAQRLSIELEDMIRDWSHQVAQAIVETAGSKNVSEWCKKPDCWKAIQKLHVEWPAALPPEMAKVVRESNGWGTKPTEIRVAADPDDVDATRRCRELDPADWIRILEWGASSGRLNFNQRELVSDIAGIAAGGWVKELSSKAAREGRQIINSALESGVLETSGAA